MSDSSYISVTRHRSALSSSTLSGSAGFGPGGGGHSFVPSGRASNLDLVDDGWAKATLPPSTLDLSYLEHSLPLHISDAEAGAPARGDLGDSGGRGSGEGGGAGGYGGVRPSAGGGDVGATAVQAGFNRFVNGGVHGSGEVREGGSGWGGVGERGKEDVERWGESGLEGMDA